MPTQVLLHRGDHGPLVFFRGSYASLTDQQLPACG